ncbi:EAL domain-containing protein [Porticoccus sp. W117]|uniref:EAL domain-containing protein n=1 Tax=Porticoccus sp. W117 TaxID=3054777 RepID=UPI0025973A23|nr:EAL domain-containing protein [Porticoccus sp. W117]MDM3871146.1 EAL domain-containing protein [Porticoccus sp. W117]
MIVNRGLFALSLCAIFVLIWVALAANVDEDDRLLASLAELRTMNGQLNEEVGRNYIGISANYDPLISYLNNLQGKATEFARQVETIENSAGRLQNFRAALSGKEQRIEDFKFHNSVMRLTWHHYPTLTLGTLQNLEEHANSGDATSVELLLLAKKLAMSTSLFVNSDQSADSVRGDLKALNSLRERFGSHEEDLNLLAAYSEKIIDSQGVLDDLTVEIYEHRLEAAFDQIERFLLQKRQASEQRIGLLRIAALLGAIFLSGVVIYLLKGIYRTSRKLDASQEQADFQQYVLNEHAMVSIIDTDGVIRQVSDRFCEVLGYQRDELVGKPRSVLFSAEHDRDAYAKVWQLINSGETWKGEVCLDCKNGEKFWSITTIIPKQNRHGEIVEFIFIRTDISELKRAEAEISVLARLPEENPEAVLRIDEQHRVVYANKPATYLLNHWDIAQGDRVPETWQLLFEDLRRTGRNQEVEVESAGRCFLLLIIPVAGSPYINIYSRDITARKKAEKELAYMAYHDDLTGLINRGAFEQELNAAVLSAANGILVHTLMYIDLNQFKIVNDTCGHVAGDELLKQVTRILNEAVRSSDIVGRLGGDEFGVILWGCDVDAAMKVAEKITAIMQGFRFTWNELFFDVGASIGVVRVDDGGSGVEDLMGKADVACYSAKEEASKHIHLYQEQASEASTRHNEMHWVSRITRALEKDRFCLFVQPIVALKPSDDRPRYEVLVRLKDDNGELIPPGAFLPAAERFKQITLIDSCVVNKIFQFMAQHTDYIAEHNPVFCINLSGTSLGDTEILELVTKNCEQYPDYMQHLHFEVTETSAVKDFAVTSSFIEKFLILGCEGISLDDFGSGMSSFAYLQQLPVDAVKIDGSFVKDMVGNEVNYSIVKSVHDIGHALGMETVAEWVEDAETVELLKEVGVDYIQGYVISAPFPIEELLAVESWQRFSQVV